jgi:hypothetical protein
MKLYYILSVSIYSSNLYVYGQVILRCSSIPREPIQGDDNMHSPKYTLMYAFSICWKGLVHSFSTASGPLCSQVQRLRAPTHAHTPIICMDME